MPNRKAKERALRPLEFDYKASLEKRLGNRPHLCDISQMDFGVDPNNKRRPYQLIGGIAIIDICGFLSNRAYWWDETDYNEIQDEASLAADDADVKGILLWVNSPGGSTENAFETHDDLLKAAKKKPMYAVAEPMAYSAAYLLACAAQKIYVPPITGGVGSIGVFSIHFDFSEMLKQVGVKATIISAGTGKTDGNPYEPLSDRAEKKIRAEVMRLYGHFVDRVAAGRNLTPDKVRTLGAFPFPGSQESIGAGLADAPGNFDRAWNDLSLTIDRSEQRRLTAAASADSTTDKENPAMKQPQADATENTAKAAAQNNAPPAAAPPNAAKSEEDKEKKKDDEEEDDEDTTEGKKKADNPAPAPAAAAPPAPAAPATAAAGAEYTLEMCDEINSLCTIFGDPALGAAYISARKTPKEVRADLQSKRASADAAQPVRNTAAPGDGTAAKQSIPIVEACERMANDIKQMKGGK